jgi:hypothetical protein
MRNVSQFFRSIVKISQVFNNSNAENIQRFWSSGVQRFWVQRFRVLGVIGSGFWVQRLMVERLNC